MPPKKGNFLQWILYGKILWNKSIQLLIDPILIWAPSCQLNSARYQPKWCGLSLYLSEASAENSYDIYHRSVKNTNIGRNPAFVLFNRIISSKKTTLNKHISLDNKMLGNQFCLSSYVNEKPRDAYFSSVSESEGKTSWLQWHPPYYVKKKINFIKNTVGPKIRLDCPLQNYLNLTIKCRNVESLDCSLLPYLI